MWTFFRLALSLSSSVCDARQMYLYIVFVNKRIVALNSMAAAAAAQTNPINFGCLLRMRLNAYCKPNEISQLC